MIDLLIAFLSLALGSLFLPLGLLPSILLFRDLADGTDRRTSRERSYAFAVWGGLLAAWIGGTLISYVMLRTLFG